MTACYEPNEKKITKKGQNRAKKMCIYEYKLLYYLCGNKLNKLKCF